MNYRNRTEWGASYDVAGRVLMTGLPVSTIYIHHTVTVPSSDPNHDMRQIESIDIGRFGIPSYSWVIHPSGTVLEGMGIHRGAHTINNANQSQNNIAFGISYIGNFENDQPTTEAIKAGGELIAWIKTQGWLQDGWSIRGHRDVYSTACPGANLYPRIQEIKDLSSSPQNNPQEEEEVAQSIAWNPNGSEFYEAGRGGDDNIWIRRWNGTQWSPDWCPIPGNGKFSGGPSLSFGPGGRLDVAARGLDGALWRNTLNGTNWSGWFSDGGNFK